MSGYVQRKSIRFQLYLLLCCVSIDAQYLGCINNVLANNEYVIFSASVNKEVRMQIGSLFWW